ncbi:MAG TPA: CoA transferase, partial [Dehalococcoidales bacterium]|nr:CoA transferase [Dehalococcoidales bacterium]
FGNTIESVAGLTNLTGYAGESPHLPGMITGDVFAALHGVSAVMVALRHRRLTAAGQHIDLSQAEAQTSAIGARILEYQMSRKEPERAGNFDTEKAPHGCYRCRGEDKWVAITVASENEWEALCTAMGNPEWTQEERFSTLKQRRQQWRDLDKRIAAWTANLGHLDVMHRLQSAGVTCGALLNGRELLENEHLNERGFFVEIPHAEAGTHKYAGTPVKLSATPAHFSLSAPLLGEHNDNILKELLGIGEAEIELLRKCGALGTTP